MRLLHVTKPRFEDFTESHIPAYGILSHRWGDSEVSYQELVEVLNPNQKLDELLGNQPRSLLDERYAKIQACRRKAARQNLEWVWIDTCCINKESSAELSEAINSMYRWYERSFACLVYMSDVYKSVPDTDPDGVKMDDANANDIRGSKWFTRGWTLQELLAPRNRILFYDANWKYLGDRNNLAEVISERTRIDLKYIQFTSRSSAPPLSEASIAKRMSWAAGRKTTRPEDMAYCLLGIFDVNMPLLYGEGKKAFVRLQLEIIRKNDDESIFAWRRGARYFVNIEKREIANLHDRENDSPAYERNDAGRGKSSTSPELQPSAFDSGLLAQEPSDFAGSRHIKTYPLERRVVKRLPYSMTNRGLLFYVDAYPSVLKPRIHKNDLFHVPLDCYEDTSEESDKAGEEARYLPAPIVITLRKEVAGDDQHWRRHDCRSFQGPYKRAEIPGETKVQTAFYIRQDGL